MYKSISFYGAFNNRTGYGIHTSMLADALEKLIPVYRNQPGGEVSISLFDTVTASQATQFPPKPSILLNVWESDLQPDGFIENLKNYSQLWVASEAQRAWSIAQGVKEEFVFTVPEGIDPDVFKPLDVLPSKDTFDFLVVGQFQRRKSTLEIIQSFLKAFPDNPRVRLYLSVDTLYPSDPWKSTEERLEKNGIFDDRIIPVHFEERDVYVRRLQTCHVYVQCSRSEGFGRPGIEAMACGAVAILENYGGSTEFSDGALLVNVPKLETPQGIYGGWDVPGQWGEPDYDHLVEVMRDAYENYSTHKLKALITSTNIRTKFSWESAAKRAYSVLEDLSRKSEVDVPVLEKTGPADDPEKKIRVFASKHNYEITSMRPRKAIFTVNCWPNSQEKMDTLSETIKQIHGFGYPVLVSSHFPLPAAVIEQADFYLYEKADRMSGDDKPIYWRKKLDGTVEQKQCGVEYQGVAAINCFRNSIDFCRDKYDWIYDMSADMEVDLEKWLSLVLESEKPMVCIPYEGNKNGIGGGLWAGRTEALDKVIPYLDSWKQYADMYPNERFVAEKWIFNYVRDHYDINEIGWIEIETTNRFDNVDRNVWADDEFQCHFIEGPYLNIVGLSNREYDVEFNDGTEVAYTLKQKSGVWSRPSKKYFRPWTVTVRLDGEIKFQHKLDLKGKRVLISLGSKALGDTIAWIPYVDEFRKKHGCHVICSGWWGHIFDYPEVEFVNPGTKVEDVYASYDVGCFDGQLDKNVKDWRLTILQQVSSDILGLDYEPIRAKMKYEPHKSGNGNEPKPYICFSEFSTMRNKLWNREGAWQKIIDYCNSLGYDCVSVSAEQTQLQNVIRHNGQSIEQTLSDVSGCEFYIGLNAGPSWIVYALNIPCIMITGVSEIWNDFPNPYRMAINNDVCGIGCFNDPILPIDRGWEWCPRKKDYICTREITESMVIEQIDKIREVKGYATKTGKIKRSRVVKHQGDDEIGPSSGSKRGCSNVKRREIQEEIQA